LVDPKRFFRLFGFRIKVSANKRGMVKMLETLIMCKERRASMNGLKSLISKNNDVQSLVSGIEEGLKEQLVAGLSGSSRAMLIASVYEETKRPILVVTHNLLQAQKIHEDLFGLLPEDELYIYPANELIAAELSIASPELRAQRIEALNYWSSGMKGIVIVPIPGLRKLLPPKDVWKTYQLTFKVGAELDLGQILNTFVSMGYQRAEMVSTPGEFSLRGGIIDIYPITESNPVRIELFDTEIDSIRSFSIEDQRSMDKLSSVLIGPMNEALLEPKHIQSIVNKLEGLLSKSLKKVKDEKTKEQMVQTIGYELEQLKNGSVPDQIFKYVSLAYEKPASLIDYLPVNGLVILDEISRIQEMNESLEKEEAEWYTDLLSEGRIVHDIKIAHRMPELIVGSSRPFVYLSLFLRHVPHTNPQNIINLTSKQMQNFHGQMHVFKSEIERWKKSNFAVVLLGPNEERVKKLGRVLGDYEIEAAELAEDSSILPGKIQILKGHLNSGFELPMQ
jgi:transcription-repair coupling factor (superfamily II helicase)